MVLSLRKNPHPAAKGSLFFPVCFVAAVEICSRVSQPLLLFEFLTAQPLLALTELF